MEPIPPLPIYLANLGKYRLNTSIIIFVVILYLFTFGSSLIQVKDDSFHQWLPTFPNPRISYSDHCNNIVPEAPIGTTANAPGVSASALRFDVGVFSSGDTFFDRNQPPPGFAKSASFMPLFVRKTLGDKRVYEVHGRLSLRMLRSFSAHSSGSDRRNLRILRPPGGLGFGFVGFWSESTGQLCMVGSSSFYSRSGNLNSFDAVLKLNYSTNSTIYGILVKGALESVVVKGDPTYFEPVSLLGVAQNSLKYEYKLAGQGKGDCSAGMQDNPLPLAGVTGGLCSVLSHHTHVFELKYVRACGGNVKCNPVSNGISSAPEFMAFRSIRCEEKGKMILLLSFGNSSNSENTFPFDPSVSVVAEGVWDETRNQFCAVACRFSHYSTQLSNATVDDCSVGLSLSFPSFLSVRRTSVIIGEVWSKRTENDPSYFSRIKFSSIKEPLWRFSNINYKYTEIERARKCYAGSIGRVDRKGNVYPNAHSSDMSFLMLVKNSEGVTATGHAHGSPLFVGNQLYGNTLMLGQGAVQPGVALHMNNHHGSFTNISYRITFPYGFEFGGNNLSRSREISAEGTYNKNTGILCMIGCQSLRTKDGSMWEKDSYDCDIEINIKFSPIKSNSENLLMGSIESTRKNSDALYFGRVVIWSKSISARQAKESVWRMDFEIIMVLISNTLSFIFAGLQLYHIEEHPQVLPFISMVMLIILTLGHMIPLLLNFEALFKTNQNEKNLLFGDDGWLEANEIVVRMVTMVAFLMEFRILQLCWTARKDNENRKVLWDSDKKVLYFTLPLLVSGGLISWLVNRLKSPYPKRHHWRNLLYRPVYLKRLDKRPSLWEDLKSYGGLIVDGFLLPQILFNAFCNSKDNALSASFYIGTTLVRLLPHAYDLFRSRSFSKLLDWSYIYANHKMDYYSTSWNIIIPCGGLLFASLIFSQQRFGGRCILPKRFRGTADGYERVPVPGSVELQGEDVQKSVNSL